MSEALITRLGRAKQDCRTVFGEKQEDGGIPILHSPGPAARNELNAARMAIQERINALGRGGNFDTAAEVARRAAYEESRDHRQYDGMWDGWILARITGDYETAMGTASRRDDYVIVDPALYESLCGCGACPTEPDLTFYSILSGINTSIGVEMIDFLSMA